VIYNELVARGYSVRTGSVYGKEIDFVATKGDDRRLYIQVAYEVTEKNRLREFGNLELIRDNYPKFVISRDKLPMSVNGIIHQNIIDFLLGQDI
jgi:predicted AAA+ superfamily ATPase